MNTSIRTWKVGSNTYGTVTVTDNGGELLRTITVRAAGAGAEADVAKRLAEIQSEFSATARRECGGPSMGVGNPMHAGSGAPRRGCKSPTHGTGEGLGHG